MQQIGNNKDENRLFDLAHTKCCRCRWVRRRVSEIMRRIQHWLNKLLTPSEVLPKEFEHLTESNDRERLAKTWSRFL